MLDFAKIERGKGVYEFAEADVGEVVERAVDLVSRRRIDRRDDASTLEIEPELPLVELDANAFTLAVMNLIDNAIKYAADGKKIELELARATQGERDRADRARLRARASIPRSRRRSSSASIGRARCALKPIRGSGIGLALVRHIARRTAATSTVDERARRGLDLPAVAADLDMTSLVTEEPATKKRILVIEDEPDIVRGLRDALEFEGFEVLREGHRRRGPRRGDGLGARLRAARPDAARRQRLSRVRDAPRSATRRCRSSS